MGVFAGTQHQRMAVTTSGVVEERRISLWSRGKLRDADNLARKAPVKAQEDLSKCDDDGESSVETCSQADVIEAMAAFVFQLLDENHDGEINASEAQRLMRGFDSEDAARDWISNYDLDKSGEIDMEEWTSYFSKMAAAVGFDDAIKYMRALVQRMKAPCPE